jgi:hypothetical protein
MDTNGNFSFNTAVSAWASSFQVTGSAAGTRVVRIDTANSQTAEWMVGIARTATNNSIYSMLLLSAQVTTGSASAGYGIGIDYLLETSSTNDRSAARQAVFWTDATEGAQTAAYSVSTVTAAGAVTEAFRTVGGNFGLGILRNVRRESARYRQRHSARILSR